MHKQGNINGYQKNNSLMALGILLQVSKPKTYNFKNPNLSKKSMLLKLVIKKPKKKKKNPKIAKNGPSLPAMLERVLKHS